MFIEAIEFYSRGGAKQHYLMHDNRIRIADSSEAKAYIIYCNHGFYKVRWPSGLRRQTKVSKLSGCTFLIWSLRGRGFESHSHHFLSTASVFMSNTERTSPSFRIFNSRNFALANEFLRRLALGSFRRMDTKRRPSSN